jgi:hypothetical protein
MKIYDIISENNIQEGPVDLLKLAGKGIASGAKWLAQTGSRRDLVDMMSQNSRIIKDALRGTAPTAAQIEAIYGPRAAEIFTKDPNFMAKVLKQFHIDRLSTKLPNPGKSPNPNSPLLDPTKTKISGSTANAITQTMKYTGYVATALKLFGLWQMTMDYRAAIARGEKELAAGRWDQEKFNDYHKNQMGTLITQIAIAGPFFLALKVSTGWSVFNMGLKATKIPSAVALGTTLSTLTTGTQAALIQLLNTKENRLAIAELTANTFIDNTLADYAIKGVNGVTRLVGLAKQKASSAASTTEPGEPDATNKDKPTAPNPTPTSEPPKDDYDKSGLDPRFKGISPNKAS